MKLINFAEELFNREVKNMTDLQAEHEEGFAEGKEQGFAEGKIEGRAEGHAEGHAEGKAEGKAEGRAEGLVEGKAEGRAETKNDAISVLQGMGLSAEKVAEFKAKLDALKPQNKK